MTGSKAGVPVAGLRLLSKADIIGASDLAWEFCPTPEWGEGTAVKVKALDVNRRQAYWDFGTTLRREGGEVQVETNFHVAHDAALAALSIVGEDDEPLFTLAEVEVLGTKHPAVIGRIADTARRLSRMRPEDQEVIETNLKGTNGASHSV